MLGVLTLQIDPLGLAMHFLAALLDFCFDVADNLLELWLHCDAKLDATVEATTLFVQHGRQQALVLRKVFELAKLCLHIIIPVTLVFCVTYLR